MHEGFQRARTDQQREHRRHEILTVTRDLLSGQRVATVSLNEIARQVGLAKSNVLRYYGSREAILLVLLADEYRAWVADVETSLLTGDEPDPVEHVAATLAATAATRPLLCELLTATPTVLEHNVTPGEVTTFKLTVAAQMERLIASLAHHLGPWNDEAKGVFLGGLHALITGMWSLAHPSPALAEAMRTDNRIRGLPHGLEASLRESLATLLTGLQHREPRLQ